MKLYKKQIILSIISVSAFDTKKIGYKFAHFFLNHKEFKQKKNIILLEGCIGSGKTTFIKGIAKKLGITKNVNSPTFFLLKHYPGKNIQLYHLDLYKILQFKRNVILTIIEELTEDIELGDMLVVESTQNILSFFPNWNFKIKIYLLDIKNRKILIEKNE
ncbi:tRNA threonylcarbamoyl adenosine modification protein YjeE [Candidatus Phytoplasma oryzae]|uniref:tRNA threonylcarbamoyladenosine biosynthesis protein TsaE n=1 Tax=Candidatus Phytoplasma oryzae TaxID=203274 RepID=A0A139JQS4_9MOLU|nr:tRNA (adenosine(37)-N6)-threonylcarbamoyltransferase complex ATPase subunit type 1 TsaE [Candidatus Phytoplasma oryzae]KXT29337.1 tRNA threonylcarbamoyl adenosine modification protein YjeE [Candidatus Phytoplasma oryzae]RAM57891.1 hypothetical protein DH96_01060 [Candidatus Phytoplasma oryzae]